MTPSALAQGMHGVVEPLHAILYFASDVHKRFAELGLEPRGQGYIAGRSAPMGAVGPQLAASVFFNFNPAMFHAALPATWDVASPSAVLEARSAGIQAVYERVGAPTEGLAEATDLVTRAVAGCTFEGRPLAAANVDVPLPGAPFADLFQLLAVVREHRGDGHIAVLVSEQLAPVEALVLYTAWQDGISRRFLQKSRFWDDDAWDSAVASLSKRGLHDGGGLTEAGRTLRDRIEERTDDLAAQPWEALGEAESLRLFDLLAPLASALNEGDAYPRPFATPVRPA